MYENSSPLSTTFSTFFIDNVSGTFIFTVAFCVSFEIFFTITLYTQLFLLEPVSELSPLSIYVLTLVNDVPYHFYYKRMQLLMLGFHMFDIDKIFDTSCDKKFAIFSLSATIKLG